MSSYLSEAFKKLDVLDEDVFDLDKDGLHDLKEFEDSDENDDSITVVDPDAEDEEELEDSYIGKVILDCAICHTDIYKDKEDIIVDEESGLANIGEECPYCFSNEGYKVIGEVKPFVEVDVDSDDDVDVEVDGEEVEEDEMDESFSRKGRVVEGIFNNKKSSNNGSSSNSGKSFRVKRIHGDKYYIIDNNGKQLSGELSKEDAKQLAQNLVKKGYEDEYGVLGEACQGRKSKKSRKMNESSAWKTFEKAVNEYEDLNNVSIDVDETGDNYLFAYEEDADDFADFIREKTGLNVSIYEFDMDEIDPDSYLNEYRFSVYLDESIHVKKSKKSIKESCSINQCQKWVDYDMKKYKKISDDTMEKIKSSGYSVVKDQYGDYEVIADRKDESLNGDQYNQADAEFMHMIDKFYRKWKKNGIDPEEMRQIVIDHTYNDYVMDGAYKYESDRKDESCGERKSRKMKESIEDITIDTGDQEISVSARNKEPEETGEEMIAPLSDEEKTDIEMNTDEDEVDVDVDEFSEEDFDKLGESYLKKVYENVDSYKTTSIKSDDKKLYLEGLIKFNSGKEKKTSFVFEAKTITKNGKAKLIGENLQISKGHKSFKLGGTLSNGKFISESLNYNYRVKDGEESRRIYGTVKTAK